MKENPAKFLVCRKDAKSVGLSRFQTAKNSYYKDVYYHIIYENKILK